MKGGCSSASSARRLQLATSSLIDDLRASRGSASASAWRKADCICCHFAAREFGAQQVRRMVGVLVAVVRGVEGDDYLQRCLDPRQQVATPLAPSESQWLACFSFEAQQAAMYLPSGPCAKSSTAAASIPPEPVPKGFRGPAKAHAQAKSAVVKAGKGYVLASSADNGQVTPSKGSTAVLVNSADALLEDEKRAARQAKVARAIEAALLASCGNVVSAWAEFMATLEAGDATRSQDDVKLRSAAASGDMHTMVASLAKSARINAQDEYGRSPLFLAASQGRAAAVDYLLQHGARATQTANGGWLPSGAAAAAGHRQISSVLSAACEASAHKSFATLQPVIHKALAVHQVPHGIHQVHGPRATWLLPRDLESHPGAGTLIIDNALSPAGVDALMQLWRALPVALKDKPSPIDRAYYADIDGWLCSALDRALASCGLLPAPVEGAPDAALGSPFGTLPLVRFLHYATAGGSLPAHVDLPRNAEVGLRTTHTFLLYLTDCEHGGETLMLEAKPGDAKLASAGGVAPGQRAVLARSPPRRGRLLIMPHACPHSAAPAISVPKLLVRGEVLLPIDRHEQRLPAAPVCPKKKAAEAMPLHR
mmetsp:Transcript_50348/g.163143  ORF Transcript_50348/g.163143 Transcript_50348/m.163143 type:complete len:595 (-) Transcript_50348:541-2325(-)